jgi:hypothetical protein
MNCNPKVTEYIGKAESEQIEVLEEIRELIHQSVENVHEEIKWNMPVFSQSKNFAYLRFAKNHITLGFYHIDKLIDPENLLEGEGNTLKHIKIRSLNDGLKAQISLWLKQITSEVQL